jgi:solute carrier family 25 iron transporter 28/37
MDYSHKLLETKAICIVDTIKTRLQITTQKGTHLELLKKAIFSYNITSLYRGLPITLLFSVPALSVYLSCYEATKQILDQKYDVDRDSVISHLTSGCAAEVAAGLLFTPMEVLKNRLQTQHRGATSLLIIHILKREGIKGFYKGYWMGLVVFVPHSMAYFVTYEKMKQWLIKDEKSKKFQLYMVCSSIAGITSIMLSTPLDIIKTRWQISAADQGAQFRQGPLGIAKQMWQKEGKIAFTRGLWARIAWGIPTTAISMTVFELLKDNRHKIFPHS